MSEPNTIVSYISDRNSSSCGYCSGSGSYSSGMWAHFMSVNMYQKLIDRGWRRSGRYVYKPKMKKTCCPLYTIRCHATKYQPSKSQKKVAKKVNNFLLHGKKSGQAAENTKDDRAEEEKPVNKSTEQATAGGEAGSGSGSKINPDSEERRVLGLKKAKVRRIERSLEKRKDGSPAKPVEEKIPKNQEKLISDYLPNLQSTTSGLNKTVAQSETGKEYKHKLTLRLVKADPKDMEFWKHFKESYGVYKKYQMAVHNDSEERCSERTFLDFLCDSPLIYEKSAEKDLLMGSFHQHYLIDDKIIAVGVIDILPGCVSSVYFYYDPDYSNLSLGTYSAIREIQLCCSLGIEFYYMGYYIHSCPKMRYKGKYFPSDLCSPTSYRWHDIAECIPLLDESKYSTFEEEGYTPPDRTPSMQKVKVYMKGDLLMYSERLKNSLAMGEQRKMAEFMERCEDLAEGLIATVNGPDEESDSD